MAVNDLYRDHFKRLVASFGVANALSQYRDNKLARAVGNDAFGAVSRGPDNDVDESDGA